ncbi:MAG TPA: hypothetical protein VGK40_11590 [Verrucomicrobiae bacterium]|jgi:hypothetical protein
MKSLRLQTLLAALGLSLLVLLVFHRSAEANIALFSNDGPLGAQATAAMAMPAGFTGVWFDIYWLGANYGVFPLSFGGIMMSFLNPVTFSKWLIPICILFAGVAGLIWARQNKLSPLLAAVLGVAAMLNSNPFSTGAWGLGGRAVMQAFAMLALAAVWNAPAKGGWPRFALAGLCIGMGLVDSADVGVIYSLYPAAFVFFQALVASDGSVAQRVARGTGRGIVMAAFAFLISYQFIDTMIHTQIKGVVGMEQDAKSKAARWDPATQWSLPKKEALRVIIPGLFGYRMDTPEGGEYCGAVGRDPNWRPEYGANGARHSGGGEYAGVPVVLLALWALVLSFQKRETTFSLTERRFLWFWAALALLSLLFAFGRHAPFYRIIYSLPYFSTIRNPIKWLHPFHMIVLILFGYGLLGLWRRYLTGVASKANAATAQAKGWWARLGGFEKRWTLGCLAAIGVSVLGWLIYASAEKSMEAYLTQNAFSPGEAPLIFKHSLGEVGCYIVFLSLSVALATAIASGAFAGRRSRWAGAALGLLVLVDLWRADRPWILHYDYARKYAGNPVIDTLRDKPYEHRVTAPPFLANTPALRGSLAGNWYSYHYSEWLQHHYPFYQIQTIDFAQMPRAALDFQEMRMNTFSQTNVAAQPRLWQLTNTRYVLGLTGFLDPLNQLDGGKGRFRIVTTFDVVTKPGVRLDRLQLEDLTIAVVTNGPLALFEFSGALPRVKLYSNWQISTNDAATLQELASPAFDPEQTVLVSDNLAASAATNQPAGNAQIKSYAPKRVVIEADARTPAVLLLNDRYDPQWNAYVDGQKQPLLRCNYTMCGVLLQPGKPHTVEFRFEPPIGGLYVSLAALGLGLTLCGLLVFSGRKSEREQAETVAPRQAKPSAKGGKS